MAPRMAWLVGPPGSEFAYARAQVRGRAVRLSHPILSPKWVGERRSADHGGHMNKLSDSSSTSLVTRAIDAVDRGHARAAARLHAVRNDLLATLERGIDRAEKVSTTAIERARSSIKRVDKVSADAVNRTQGLVGHAIEKARLARTRPAHLAS